MKLTERQFKYILYFSLLGSQLLYMPKLVLYYLDHNGWMAIILTGLFAVGLIFIVPKQLFETNTAPMISQVIVGVVIALYATGLFVFELMVLGQFITFQYLMGTPFKVLIILLLLTVFILGSKTLEHVGRTVEVFYYLPTVSIFLILIMALIQVDTSALKPVQFSLDLSLLKACSLFFSVIFTDGLVVLKLGQFVKDASDVKGLYVKTVLKVMAFLTFGTIISVMILGSKLTTLTTYPLYHVLMNIHWFSLLERIEAIFSLFVIVTSVMKMVILLYIIIISFNASLSKQAMHVVQIGLLIAMYFLTNYFIRSPIVIYNWLYSKGWYILMLITMVLLLSYQLLRIPRQITKKSRSEKRLKYKKYKKKQ